MNRLREPKKTTGLSTPTTPMTPRAGCSKSSTGGEWDACEKVFKMLLARLEVEGQLLRVQHLVNAGRP